MPVRHWLILVLVVVLLAGGTLALVFWAGLPVAVMSWLALGAAFIGRRRHGSR